MQEPNTTLPQVTPWLIGVTLTLFGAAFALLSPTSAAAQEGDTLTAAIQAYAESEGEVYAGPCSQADVEEDVGKWCSEIRALSNSSAEVAFGPAFSEFVETVEFINQNSTWSVDVGFSPPSGVSTTTFDEFVRVFWNSGENNNFYCIDTAFTRADLLNINGSWSNWACGTTATSYDLTNLACDSRHYFRVWAAGPDTSGYSEIGTFRSQSCNFTSPANPQSELMSATRVQLSWVAGANNHFYCADLARSQGALVNLTGTWFNTGCGTTSTAIEVSGLTCNATYYWRAWAAGTSTSGYTPIASFTTPPCQSSAQPVTITGSSATSTLTDVRIGAHAAEGFDRIVFEFANGLPVETIVQYESSAAQCGSGFPVSLDGSAILTVHMSSSQAHNDQGQTTIDATALGGTSGAIFEAQQICDFEGIVQWAVGIDEVANFQVITLSNPDRIVIDLRR